MNIKVEYKDRSIEKFKNAILLELDSDALEYIIEDNVGLHHIPYMNVLKVIERQ